jgi:hypothetical protein
MDIHYSVSATHLKPPVALRSNPVKPAKAFAGDEGFSGHPEHTTNYLRVCSNCFISASRTKFKFLSYIANALITKQKINYKH